MLTRGTPRRGPRFICFVGVLFLTLLLVLAAAPIAAAQGRARSQDRSRAPGAGEDCQQYRSWDGPRGTGSRRAARQQEEVLEIVHEIDNADPNVEYFGDWPVTSQYIATDGGSVVIHEDDGTDINVQFTGFWVFEEYAEDGADLIVSNQEGASVEVTFYGRSVEVVSARYWSCGWCQPYYDGWPRRRVDLYLDSDFAEYDYTVFRSWGLWPRYHTVELVNLGIASTPENEEYGLHFANLDYLILR